MIMRNLMLSTISAIALIAGSLRGATLFDSVGFESPTYTLGSLDSQNGWIADGTGQATVQNSVVENGSQAVRLSGATTTWHFPDLSYTPASGEIVRVTSGIRFGSSTNGVKNFGYFLDAYNFSTARIGRVGLGISGGSPAIFATTIGGSGAGTYVLATGLSYDTFYDFQMDLKFATQKFDLYVNNVLIGADLPFLTASVNVADVDLQMSSTAGATDVGCFDNYKVLTIVPEPGVFSLAALGGLTLTVARRRAARQKACSPYGTT
jgi:hypothetical protein